MESTLAQAPKLIQENVDNILRNPLIMAVVKLSLTLYAIRLAPRLPENIDNLLSHTLAKVIGLSLIVYLSEKDFQLAILIAIIYVFGTNLLSGRQFYESFSDYSKDFTSATTSKLIEPRSVIYPGCEGLKMADIEKAFEEKNLDLQQAVMYSYKQLSNKVKSKNAKETLMKIAYATGLPYNIEFTDENAPYIATLLMYYGFNISTGCMAPQQ